jgi:hypothetical protein
MRNRHVRLQTAAALIGDPHRTGVNVTRDPDPVGVKFRCDRQAVNIF